MATLQYQNKWLVSYETLLFNTSDGDLDTTQYALDGNDTGYYIRTIPKNQGQFEWVDLKYDVSKLKLVKIVVGGHAYYDEYLTAVGATALWGVTKTDLPSNGKIRVQSTAVKYNPLKTIKDYPQPSRTEMVSVLPPTEPIQDKSTHNSIGFDATSNSGVPGAVSSYAWNHTCGATADLLVFGDSHGSNPDVTVTAVTYNGVSLTFISSDTHTGSHYRTTLHYMVAPTTGSAQTVSVTYSGVLTGNYGVGGVVSYSGAKQTGQPDAYNGANGSSTSAAVSVTTVADNSWVFSVMFATKTSTCDNTQRWNILVVGGDYPAGGSDTGAPKTPAGAQTMSWTQSLSGAWVISAASFAPAVALATVTTQAVTNISGTTATGNGNITNLGGASVTQHGHCWNTAGTPTTADSKTENGAASATGAFTSAITGLTAGTKYFVRAYATNTGGTSYGGSTSFTADIPLVSEQSGIIAVVETRFHYVDAYGVERFIEGTVVV